MVKLKTATIGYFEAISARNRLSIAYFGFNTWAFVVKAKKRIGENESPILLQELYLFFIRIGFALKGLLKPPQYI